MEMLPKAATQGANRIVGISKPRQNGPNQQRLSVQTKN
jgi:hypothetical protein